MNIAIGADHGGVDLKHAIITHLQAQGHAVKDYGTDGLD
ncbi:MAG TPA: ribose-5-phosphate isomerase, partial [Verrucomicrobiales bacterium]|nr:ribose-5-phosphate isomerase [Verrucomicrobiales bacterium]